MNKNLFRIYLKIGRSINSDVLICWSIKWHSGFTRLLVKILPRQSTNYVFYFGARQSTFW